MAAFSYPHPGFVLDSFLVPTTSNNMSSLTEEGTIITTKTFSSPMHSNVYLQEIPLLPQFHESCCNVQHPFSCASTVHGPISLTAKQDYSVSSPIVAEPVSGDHQLSTPDHQVVKVTPVENKRKKMDVKVDREGKDEKRRKCSGSLRKVEERTIAKADSKKQKKIAEKAPSGYVHVRAKRGQATDSHSLAERVRREKISMRMKILQSLVPGCDQITGKALILDEIIKYVQTLQTEVEFLAAKLSFVNPVINEFGVEFNTNTLGQQADSLTKTWCSDFQFPPVQESISTQLRPFFQSDQKTPTPNSLLLDQDTAAIFQDNGTSLWGTDGSRRHELVSNYWQLLRQQERQNRSRA